MPLHGYGLLIGKIVGSRQQRHGSAHWLLFVQPSDPKHPAYRVAVNLQPTERGKDPELQYQVVNFDHRATRAGRKLIDTLQRLGATSNFLTAASDHRVPCLDFIRGDIIDPKKFADLPAGSVSLRDKFTQTLAELAEAEEEGGGLLAVFGTGTPSEATGAAAPTGYTGIENIHMNQGGMNLINGQPYYLENGPNQDGGLIFLSPKGARGIFVKFRTQVIDTDEKGNPTITNIQELDRTSEAIRKAIMPPFPRATAAAKRTDTRSSVSSAPARKSSAKTTPPATANESGYVFADVDPNDASGVYKADNDANTYKTPFVVAQSSGHTRGPVPTPRGYPRMDLSSVVGTNPPGYSGGGSSKSIAFDVIGDSGAPSQQKLNTYELKVTDLMTKDAAASPPAFLFHVGDVVYFYGEQDYYYSQFYEPFRAYPAPIFAIPGNHDGITYDASMTSLGPFQSAFCATQPGRWPGSGGILRSAMTQPGVYFTLDAPLVAIIGLYSNCGESFGWLDEQQLLFFYQELVRLKKLRAGGLPAVILAIHHFPRWFPDQKPKDPVSTAIDAACTKAGLWPDAVICGHAHLYQRAVRQDTGQDIPYVLSGAGGYAVTPGEEVGKSFMKAAAASGSRLAFTRFESGYVRASVTSPRSGDPTLRFEYRSVKPLSDGPDDVCTVNLRTNKLV